MAAWGAFLATVPSALWRLLMILGLMPGTAALRTYELGSEPGPAYAYVFGLSAIQLGAGWLTVGLVRPWGERFRGRRVPVGPVVVAGVLGGLAVVTIFDVWMLTAILHGMRPDAGHVHDGAFALMVAVYAPILLWGPLELTSVWGYWRRRTAAREGRGPGLRSSDRDDAGPRGGR